MKTLRELILERHRDAVPPLEGVTAPALGGMAAAAGKPVPAWLPSAFWREIIAPWRRIWVLLAAAWVMIAAVQISLRSSTPEVARVDPAMQAVARDEQRSLAALMGEPSTGVVPHWPIHL